MRTENMTVGEAINSKLGTLNGVAGVYFIASPAASGATSLQ
jgi:hypothetical protein